MVEGFSMFSRCIYTRTCRSKVGLFWVSAHPLVSPFPSFLFLLLSSPCGSVCCLFSPSLLTYSLALNVSSLTGMSQGCGRGCREGWDVRCCCEPNCPKKNSHAQFLRCPMRIETMVFHITNNQEWEEEAQKGRWSFLAPFRFTKTDMDEIKRLWMEELKAGETPEEEEEEKK